MAVFPPQAFCYHQGHRRPEHDQDGAGAPSLRPFPLGGVAFPTCLPSYPCMLNPFYRWAHRVPAMTAQRRHNPGVSQKVAAPDLVFISYRESHPLPPSGGHRKTARPMPHPKPPSHPVQHPQTSLQHHQEGAAIFIFISNKTESGGA